MTIDVDEKALRLAKQGAMSAYRSGRNLVSSDDLTGEAYLWLVENAKRVNEWLADGRHGENKIRYATKQRCLQVVAAERKARSGLQRGDAYYYSPIMLKQVLPDIFNREDWATSGVDQQSEKRSTHAPSEGNNRLAILVDVYSAFCSLKPADQSLLRELHEDGGMHYEVVAATYGVTEKTIRRREARALDKMVESLGGEHPWV